VKIISANRSIPKLPYPVVALGNFDGLHLGHQAIIRQVIERAKEMKGTGMVFTLEPHPLKVLAPERMPRLLTNFDEKMALLEALGIQVVVCAKFTKAFSSQTPRQFVKRYLRQAIRAKEVYAGYDFSFGKDREGRAIDLKKIGDEMGTQVEIIGPVMKDGVIVSASRIREYLQAGRVAEAARLLGRPYSIKGKVRGGIQRGRKMGFPTANLYLPQEEAMPADGVYITEAMLGMGPMPSVTYIGTQPTFGRYPRRMEVHLLNERKRLYGKTLRVAFFEWLRGEMTFSGKPDLIAQIRRDVQQTQTYFEMQRRHAQTTSIPKGKA
jgi:riboflavin kinase / FMN adenylyltransferase